MTTAVIQMQQYIEKKKGFQEEMKDTNKQNKLQRRFKEL